MSDLQKEIDLLKARLDELEGRNKGGVAEPVKWQPKGGNWLIDAEGLVVKARVSWLSKEFGTVRQTKEQSKSASIEMRRFNRLLALRDELCGDEVMDWSDDYTGKYNVYFSHHRGCWYVLSDDFCESVTPYFTTQELAQKACDMLNSGDVEL